MKKEKTISFLLTSSNHILIECKINNVSGTFIVDTGASNSCINYLSASKFNLEFQKSNETASSATNEISETYFSKDNILEIEDFQKIQIILHKAPAQGHAPFPPSSKCLATF